ncbi:MAG: M18 family aminopeptidase [Gammaproteobacteria bacterium]
MDQTSFNAGLMDFITGAPTPFHATDALTHTLRQAGFERLEESAEWTLRAGGRYVVTRNGSSLIAFSLGTRDPADHGIRMVGAHTDSPCLKLKPHPEITAQGYQQLTAEVYGGVLLNPWFDRDLSLAGRVTLATPDGALCNRLVDFRSPIAVIPSLAIHLDREANDKRSINRQTHLPALVRGKSSDAFDLREELTTLLVRAEPALAGARVQAFELCFYDVQPPSLVGWREEFIASARLDNLLSCYTGMCALRDADADVAQLLVCNDHEEVGSGSTSGARGNFLESVLQRLLPAHESRARTLARSLLVSTDNAHAVHPNFADRHDPKHGPVINEGPALKTNANQSYATNSESAAVFRLAAEQAGVPLQAFVARADMGCGSTIGPLAATRLGVRTVDVGVPTFAMHSIRELAGTVDAYALYRALQAFFAMPRVVVD